MVQQNDHGFWTSFYLWNKKTCFFLGLGGGSFYNTIWILGEDGFFVFFLCETKMFEQISSHLNCFPVTSQHPLPNMIQKTASILFPCSNLNFVFQSLPEKNYIFQSFF